MAVYVDSLFKYGGNKEFRWKHSCHMYADSLSELHEMAKAIRLKREWFQPDGRLPHYDLNATRRVLAIKLGVVEHSRHQMSKFLKERN